MNPIVSSNASNMKIQTRISRIPDIEVAKNLSVLASQISIKHFFRGKIICDKSIFPFIFFRCPTSFPSPESMTIVWHTRWCFSCVTGVRGPAVSAL